MVTIPTDAAARVNLHKRQARRSLRLRQLSMLHRFASYEIDHAPEHHGRVTRYVRTSAGAARYGLDVGEQLHREDRGDWDRLTWSRTAACGRAVIADDGLVGVRSTTTDDGQVAYTDGVMRCGSVWLCPSCSATIKTHRQMELNAAAMAHSANGGAVGMLTLTVRHHQGDSLATLQDSLSAAWKSLQQSARWREFREQMVGTVVAKEITWGVNGWHPHLHVLILHDGQGDLDAFAADLTKWGRTEVTEARGRTERTVDPATGELVRRQVVPPATVHGAWAARVYNRLGKSPDHHGFDFRWIEGDAASYVAKIASEVTRGEFKTGDAHQVILAGLEQGEAWAVHRWREWVDTMPGRRMLVWSRGLRDQLLPDVEDLADDQVVYQDRGGTEVGTIERTTYRRLVRAHHGQAPMLAEVLSLIEATGTAPGLGPPRQPCPVPVEDRPDRTACVQASRLR